MQLTRYTDYSFRLLTLLGLRSDELLTIQQVSEAYGISRNHLVKIVNHLAALGYIETNRGRNGGIRLKADPEDISVGHVVRELEPSFRLVECFDPKTNECVIAAGCLLKPVLREALQAFLSVLDRYTLANLIEQRRDLELALGVREPQVPVLGNIDLSPSPIVQLGR